jgi:hypothetical protein
MIELTMTRFIDMIRELETNPKIFVVIGSVMQDASPSEASNQFAKLGINPSKECLEYYSLISEVSLWWIHVGNPNFDRDKYEKAHKDYLEKGKSPEYIIMEHCDGMVSIGSAEFMADPSFATALIESQAYQASSKSNMSILLDQNCPTRYFDEFSNEGDNIAIQFESDSTECIFLPTDEGQDFESSRVISLSSYLEFLIWSKGLKSARYDFFVRDKPDGPQTVESIDKAYFDALPSVDIDNLY